MICKPVIPIQLYSLLIKSINEGIFLIGMVVSLFVVVVPTIVVHFEQSVHRPFPWQP